MNRPINNKVNFAKFLLLAIPVLVSGCVCGFGSRSSSTSLNKVDRFYVDVKENEAIITVAGGKQSNVYDLEETALISAAQVAQSKGFRYFKILNPRKMPIEVKVTNRTRYISFNPIVSYYVLFIDEMQFKDFKDSQNAYKSDPYMYDATFLLPSNTVAQIGQVTPISGDVIVGRNTIAAKKLRGDDLDVDSKVESSVHGFGVGLVL